VVAGHRFHRDVSFETPWLTLSNISAKDQYPANRDDVLEPRAPWEPASPKVVVRQDMLSHSTIADAVGFNRFRDERQETANVAIALALYGGIDTMDGDNIVLDARVGIVESVLQGIDKRLGKKRHCTKHRTMNRFSKRATVVKCLVDLVKFKAPGRFTASPADIRCLNLVVKQVIDEAVKDGVEYLEDQVLTVRKQERAYYLKAVSAAYFIAEEDESFWQRLSANGSAVTA
jgi:hypothetical protein